MKTHATKNIFLTLLASLCSFFAFAQTTSPIIPSPFIDYDAYERLMKIVKEHRKTRLLSAQDFARISNSGNNQVIILDTRSDSAYAAVHIKGAVHLNFSDFTQENLRKIIPSPNYQVLIYCNNNFNISDINGLVLNEEIFAKAVPTKMAEPRIKPAGFRPLTLALNIPTYINLFGYGYRNVYELGELVNTYDGIIEFEGTAVK